MKKVLLFIVMLIGANMIFAQTATLRVGDVDLTGVAVGGDVIIPLYVDEIDDGTIFTMQYFIGFDHAVLTWKGSFANPLTGIQNFHPNFPYGTPNGAWLFNDNGTELVSLWDDASMFHTMPSPDQVFYEMIFTYNGGLTPGVPSPLVWGTSGKDVGGKYVKGTTEMYDQNFSQYALTLIDGSVCIGCGGPTAKVWNGTVESYPGAGFGDWLTPANWTPAGAPIATDDVIIPATTYDPRIDWQGISYCNALTIEAGATLTLGSYGFLTTNGDLTNNGTLLILSEIKDGGFGFPPPPDFTATGSIINMGAVLGTGTFQYDRVVDCTGTVGGSTSNAGWHYVSAPWDGFTTDGAPDYFVNAWDQGAGMWMHYAMDPYTNPCEAWPTTPLMIADAWSINMDLDYPNPECPGSPAGTGDVIEFIGTGAASMHPVPYTQPLGYGTGMFQDFALVGNPFPASLDFGQLVFGANTMQFAAVWAGCFEDYLEWTPAVPDIPAVGVGQGFFVQTTAPGGSVEFTAAARAHGYNVYKSEIDNLLTLTASGNDKSDKLHVRFMEDMTAGIDMNGDGPKLISTSEGLPQIYTKVGAENLAINALPSTTSVPMGFVANGTGTYTIEAIETSEFENVVLEDLSNGVQTDLLAGSYTFDYTTSNTEHGFVIHFTPLGTNELAANSINIWAANQTIYVQAPATKGDIAVYNMMGQVVVKTAIVPGLNEIPMNTSNTYYIVKVLGSDVTETGKVFIK